MMRSVGSESEYICIGTVRKAFGLDGWCGVTLFGSTLQQLGVPCAILLGSEPSALEPGTIVAVKKGPKGPLCQFSGIADRDQAEALRDKNVYIEKQRLPQPENNGYYHFELEGLAVVSPGGNPLGRVVKVHNYPSVDAVEIQPGNGRNVIIPLTPDAVQGIDRQAHVLTVSTERLEDLFG